MTNSAQHRSRTLNLSFRPATAALAMAIVFPLIVVTQSAHAQTFTVLHTFTGASDGATPGGAGLTIDQGGNLYGGTDSGGMYGCYEGGCGVVYKLSHKGS